MRHPSADFSNGFSIASAICWTEFSVRIAVYAFLHFYIRAYRKDAHATASALGHEYSFRVAYMTAVRSTCQWILGLQLFQHRLCVKSGKRRCNQNEGNCRQAAKEVCAHWGSPWGLAANFR